LNKFGKGIIIRARASDNNVINIYKYIYGARFLIVNKERQIYSTANKAELNQNSSKATKPLARSLFKAI
jgi:hypothetical protein